MNALRSSLFITWATLASTTSIAFAQNSSPWADVVGWQVTYNLTGSGKGTSGASPNAFTWTVNRQFTGTATLAGVGGSGAPPGALAWSGLASTASGSGNDSEKGTEDCRSSSAAGSAASVGAFLAPPPIALQIDPSNNTFNVAAGAGAFVTEHVFFQVADGTCQEDRPRPTIIAFTPDYTRVSPPSFPLPQVIGVLEQGPTSFNAPTVADLYWSRGDIDVVDYSASWVLSFKLIPSRPWVKVWMSGGKTGQIGNSKEAK